ncbi:MAG TPA: MogA/MoaB family molybdenum cofactor biosynthesis protein [Microbacterium sp.]|nr:MogA/MoaB family molybdenum cofactor biosynthesis protein [Microbacterium sp.]
MRAAVVTVSDRSSSGKRPDASGPVAVDALRDAGWSCDDAVVVPDGADSVAAALRAAEDAGARLIVTSGGTGVAPRDLTPEGTRQVVDRELPGIMEELRRAGASDTPMALLTRGVAGVTSRALVVNLPGSPRGVASGMPLLLRVAGHVISQLDGGDH